MKSVEPIETTDWLGVFENALNASRGVFEDGKISVWDYSNPAHFSSLWKSLESDGFKKASHVLIIWNRTPSDESLFPVNTSEHVSPLHWAACAAKEVLQIQVCVVDLNPAAHRNQYLYEHYLCSDKSRLPWLRVVQAAHFFEGGNVSNIELESKPIHRSNLEKHLFPTFHSIFKTAPKFFINEFREELINPLEPDNRHAIANIIGPLILLGSSASLTNQFHGTALLALLKASDLLGKTTASLKQSQPSPFLWNWRQRSIHFTLIDDQAKQGWEQWLDRSLQKNMGKPEHIAIETVGTDGFDAYLSRLEKLLSDRGHIGNHDCRFTRTPTGEPIILFLDLRLFSGQRAETEAHFYKKVLRLWRLLKAQIENSNREIAADLEKRFLPWPDNITPQEIQIEQWCDSMLGTLHPLAEGEARKARLLAITLFPRVLAQLDLSLPIVLFSSSTQAQTLELMSDYGNIITCFSKPAFFGGDAAGACVQAATKLREAIQKATSLLGAGLKCESLSTLLETQPIAGIPSEDKVHIELFIDESRRQDESSFAVGGVFAVYTSNGNAIEDANYFDDLAVECGLRYFDGSFLPPDCPTPPLDKFNDSGKEQLDKSLREYRRLFQPQKSLELGYVRLKPTRGSAVALPGDLHSRDYLDNKFWFTLDCLIELFLAETVSEIVRLKKPKEISMSVYAGTRVVPVSDGGDAHFKFGFLIDRYEDKSLLRSLSSSDVYRIVTDCLEIHRLTNVHIERALAVTLPYQGQARWFPKMLVDRSRKQVFESTHGDLEFESLPPPQHGIVKRMKDAFGFVEVPGFGDVFCHRSVWRGFESACEGDYVQLEVYAAERGPQGTNVTLTNRENYEVWIEQSKKMGVSANFCRRNGVKRDSLRPDYRALHYIADQVISEGADSFQEHLAPFQDLGQFDEDLQEPLWQAVQASRKLDQGDIVGAVLEFSFRNSGYRPQRQLARLLVGRRIARRLPLLTGEEFLRVSAEAKRAQIVPSVLLKGIQHLSDVSVPDDGDKSIQLHLQSPLITFVNPPENVSADQIRQLISSFLADKNIEVNDRIVLPTRREVDVRISPSQGVNIQRILGSLKKRGWNVCAPEEAGERTALHV